MDSQSVKTTERGGVRGFDAHKRVQGRKRHILVDTSGLLIACRVAPADISDRTSATQLLGGLGPLFPNIRTIIADAGHESRKLSRHLMQQDGWKLQIVKRRQRAFTITGLSWIVERSLAWLGRNRRLSKDYELKVQTSETPLRHSQGNRQGSPGSIARDHFPICVDISYVVVLHGSTSFAGILRFAASHNLGILG
jgi:putative transposase